MTGEALGYLLEKLFDLGVRDAYFTSIYMKKNRPGQLLSVIGEEKDLDHIFTTIFKHSTTIGLRYFPVSRKRMARELIKVDSPYGQVQLKKSSYKDIDRLTPEYEDCRKIADREDLSILDVYDEIKKISMEDR